MSQTNCVERDMEKKSINGEDIEEVTVRIIKYLLSKNVAIEDIQIITNKSVEEIKRIGGLSD